MTETNAPDAPPGTPTYTVSCLTREPRWCGRTYEYRGVGIPTPDDHATATAADWHVVRNATVTAAVGHLDAHTRWTASAFTDDDGFTGMLAWCPEHANDPAAVACRTDALAAELRATVTEADNALAGHPVLGGPAPGTLTHALLTSARASALSGLAALTRSDADTARALYEAGLITTAEARRRSVRRLA